MQLDISPVEVTTLAAGLGLLAEVLVNPQILAVLSPPGRANISNLQQKGLWPRQSEVTSLLNKLLARLQVEAEARTE